METVTTHILSDHSCHLGEGCGYEATTDTAWWFDILERKLFEARIADGTVRVHALPVMGSVLAPVDARRQLLASDEGLHIRDRASGALEFLQALDPADAGTRSNDGRVHQSGALWISTMGRGTEKGAGAIHWFFRGELRRLFAELTVPNAISFSPDGTLGYFVDTKIGSLKRVELDPEDGSPRGEPAELYRHRGEGGLDGATVDAQGQIWCARWGGGCVDVLSPRGELLRSIQMPAKLVTCPVFVGPDFDRLLVTTASENMDDEDRRADPLHGQTFLLDVDARGRPEAVARPFA